MEEEEFGTSAYKEDARVLIDKDAVSSVSLIGRESRYSQRGGTVRVLSIGICSRRRL